MSAEIKHAKREPLKWHKVLPSQLSIRYRLLTGKDDVIEGVKTLCDSGNVELAYNVMEILFGKGTPVFLSHLDFIPKSCMVLDAREVLGYEDDGYLFAVLGFSARSQNNEFTCIYIDDVNVYGRLCTMNEVLQVWELFEIMKEGEK